MDDTVWVPTVFAKNRGGLVEHEAVVELFNEVLAIANKNEWLSGESFSVNRTLSQVWTSHKSFARKDGGDDDTGNFKKASAAATAPMRRPPMPMLGLTAKAILPVSCAHGSHLERQPCWR